MVDQSTPNNDVLLPVTRGRIAQAFEHMGLVSYLGRDNQVAIILDGTPMRVILPGDSQAQGFAQWTRTPLMAYASKMADFVSGFNLTTYLPKLTTESDDHGRIHVTLHHAFSFGQRATDAQLWGELHDFVGATNAALFKLNQEFPDPWMTPAN